MKFYLWAAFILALSSPSFAGQLLQCATPTPQDAPFHWGQLNVTLVRPGQIQVQVIQGNPQEIGSTADLAFIKNVNPGGVQTQMYHGTWRNPAQSGMKTVTYYLTFGNGQTMLSYIAETQPFHWPCR